MGRKTAVIFSFLLISLILLMSHPKQVAATSTTISKAYQANGVITDGSLVTLDPKAGSVIDEANTVNGSRLLGVAVANNSSLLAVDASDSTVQVAISGTANALVSNINGNIKVGNQVSVSPFNGIGVKSVNGAKVIGLAETSFTDSTNGATKLMVKDKQGKTEDIWVGFVKVEISIGNGSDAAASGGANVNSLQKLIKGFTGKTIPTLRIVTSLGIAMVALLSLVTLIYASIFGSIISIGRNPLAKHAIAHALTVIIGLIGLIVGVAVGAMYLLLH
jgi:hypothetical protein